ncbi:DEAD/DEAH box RNA helicase, partial [Thraustotheca clavata]
MNTMMDGAETNGYEDSVVKKSQEQREAEDGEPVCVVCGRYGEYICDVTEMDVCSMECRDICRVRNHVKTQREVLGIVVKPAIDECRLVNTFEEMQLPNQMLLNLNEMKVMQPTPIQMQVIPMALNGKSNILIDAPTGTGKTIAFLIPLITSVLAQRFEIDEILGIIVSPIRELCIQIEQEIKSLVLSIPKMKTALLVGGMPLPNQLHRLKQNIQIIVGTPGRLLTLHEEYHALRLQNIVCGVLDEVDMLCEKDFISPVTTLISLLPPQRQLIFVSATVTSHVQTLLDKFAPSTISITQTELLASKSVIPSHIEQHVEYVENAKKTNKLFAFLQRKQENPLHATMIFVASQQGADLLVKSIFKACNLPALSIHGGKTQTERLKAMEAFVAGHATILVSTYLLGRGMDLIFVDDVIVFDMPPTVEEYIHIVGRAGRSGEPGNATVYVNEDSASLLPALLSVVWKSVKIPKQLKQLALVEQSKVSSKVNVKELIRRVQSYSETQSTQSSEKWQAWSQNANKRHLTTSNISSAK